MSEGIVAPQEIQPPQDHLVPESPRTPEMLKDPRIAVVTATHYPSWYEGKPRDGEPLSADKLRGDLALEAMLAATSNGYQIALVDKSSEEFRQALRESNINFEEQKEEGLQGAARRQGLEMVSGMQGVKVVCETEPEKVYLIANLGTAARPILDGEADIVVPKRIDASFTTLPEYQAETEQKANRSYNKALRLHLQEKGLPVEELLPEGRDIDFWFGVRLLANRPEVVELFTEEYEFKPGEWEWHKNIRVDMYSNPLFYPVAEALYRKLRVETIEIPYMHPAVQTKFEEGKLELTEKEADKRKKEYDKKRNAQRRNILVELGHLLRLKEIKEKPHRKSRLTRK